MHSNLVSRASSCPQALPVSRLVEPAAVGWWVGAYKRASNCPDPAAATGRTGSCGVLGGGLPTLQPEAAAVHRQSQLQTGTAGDAAQDM